MKIVKLPNGASLELTEGTSEDFTASELLSLSEGLKSFVIENADSFDQTPVKVVQFRGRKFRVSVTDKLWFWEELEQGKWESQTFDTFDKYIDQDTVFLDVGGWIGSTSLYAAQVAKRSVAFEPDPVAYNEFKGNLELNRGAKWANKLELLNAAIAMEKGEINLGFRDEAGDSMSSVLLADDSSSHRVEAIEFSDFLNSEKLVGEKLFTKMDIEGYEYEVIPALSDCIEKLSQAVFHVSLHPQFLLDKLNSENRNQLLNPSLTRKLFYQKHKGLLDAFKGYKCYYATGKRINRRKLLTKALVTADFPRDLVFVKNWS
jgi:FkbM family methyltransferase